MTPEQLDEIEKLAEAATLEWGPDEGEMTWTEAIAVAKAKYDGWRLPTVAELVSMFDYDKGEPKDAGFQCAWYWSSSVYSVSITSAWLVSFIYGGVSTYGVSGTSRVRCVRDVGGGK